MSESETISVNAPCDSLADVVDEYMIENGIDKKKYFTRYIVIAKREWQKLFWNTLYCTKNVWKTIQAGDPYDYIDIPRDVSRIFSIEVVDRKGLLQPLYYNQQLNVIDPPAFQSCGCTKCGCSGLCEDLNSLTVTTTPMFTVGPTTYNQVCWVKYCPNGDILQWCQVPVKKYNTFTGDGGDYNSDYNNDYLIGNPPFSDFTVVTETFQTKLCSLTVRPCGCPEPTPQNEALIEQHCGCFLNILGKHRHHRKKEVFPDINGNHYGEVKISECGTKMYYRQPHNWDFCKDGQPPQFLLVNYQTNAFSPDAEVKVPDYAMDCLKAGIYKRVTKRNGMYSIAERNEAKYDYNDEVNKLIMFMNPISLAWLGNVQDATIKF
jgi:hypothetical protein